MDKICELQMDGGGDCGQPAAYVVRAAPSAASNLKPFYACREHPTALYGDLAEMGWVVQEPTPATSFKLDLPCLNCKRDNTLRIFIGDDKVVFVDCSWCGFREHLKEG